MKKIILSAIFTLLACVSAYGGDLAESKKGDLKIAAQGAVLMDYKTGRILWEKNAHTPLAMASTTKIMTAIIALENGNLDDMVTISKQAARAPEVNMSLTAGEQIKLGDLMYALMLQSYNDAAIAIAEHVSGSVEEFCKVMTEKAIELGAKDTVFETPNGLDSNNHHSTAYDLAVVTRYALENEKFMEIINTPSKVVKSDKRQYELYNKNRLLNEYQGANGVKTGFTGKAGQCFVGAAKREDMQLISVVLASGWGDRGKEQKWIDTKGLLNYGFDNFRYSDIITEGQACAKVDVTRTKTPKIDLVYETGLTIPITADEIGKITIALDYPDVVKAPIAKGQQMGICVISLENNFQASIKLLAAQDADRDDFATSLKKVLKGWSEMATNDLIDIENFDFVDILQGA